MNTEELLMSYALKKKKKSGDTTVDVDQVQKLFTGVRAINGSSAYLKNSMSLNE